MRCAREQPRARTRVFRRRRLRSAGVGVNEPRKRRRHRSGGSRRPESPSTVEADDDLYRWIEYCGGRMFVVGSTEGGAPYGHVEWPAIGFIDGAPRASYEDEPF